MIFTCGSPLAQNLLVEVRKKAFMLSLTISTSLIHANLVDDLSKVVRGNNFVVLR